MTVHTFLPPQTCKPDCGLDLPLGSLGWLQAHTSTDQLRISPRPGPLPVSASLQSSTVISPALKPETRESSLRTHPSCLPALHPPPPISGQIHPCFLLRSLSNPPTLLPSNHQGSTQGRALLKGCLPGHHLWPVLQEHLSTHGLPFLVFPGRFPT